MNIIQGDNGTVLDFTITGNDKSPIDLSFTTVKLDIVRSGVHIPKICTIVDGLNGKCQAILTSEDLSETGVYMVQLEVSFANGSKFSSNMDKFEVKRKLVV